MVRAVSAPIIPAWADGDKKVVSEHSRRSLDSVRELASENRVDMIEEDTHAVSVSGLHTCTKTCVHLHTYVHMYPWMHTHRHTHTHE